MTPGATRHAPGPNEVANLGCFKIRVTEDVQTAAILGLY